MTTDEIFAATNPRRDENGNPIVDMMTCLTCGRSWNDALPTAITPVPSGRCPYEYEHDYYDWAPCDDYAPDILNPEPEDRDICTLCYYRAIDHNQEAF